MKTTQNTDLSYLKPIVLSGHRKRVFAIAMTKDGSTIISGSDDGTIKIWSVKDNKCMKTILVDWHRAQVINLSPDENSFFAAGDNGIIYHYSIKSGELINFKRISKNKISDMILNISRNSLLICCDDKKIYELSIHNLNMMSESLVKVGQKNKSYTIKALTLFDNDNSLMCCGNSDKLIKIQCDDLSKQDFFLDEFIRLNPSSHRISKHHHNNNLLIASLTSSILYIRNESESAYTELEGHQDFIVDFAFNDNGEIMFSSSCDGSVLIWDMKKLKIIAQLKNANALNNCFFKIAVSKDCRVVAVGSLKKMNPASVSFSYREYENFNHEISLSYGEYNYDVTDIGQVLVWHLPPLETILQSAIETEKYSVAKIVMVGASGAGKTSLSHRLCEDQWKLFDSTHDGMNITKLDLPYDGAPAGHDREAWLWDLAGQPDYRLIHQLFLDETAAALLVFNPQDPDPFAEVSFWNRVLDRLVDPPPAKLLVASRGDVGGLTISQKRIDDFLKAHGFAGYIPTSAKSGMGRKELIEALAKAIPWDRLPTTSSPIVFKKLKDKLLELREQCESPLLRMDDLRERMVRALPEEPEAGEAIKGVVRIFEHQGVLRRLPFGDFILLKPEIINDYAAVITQNARQHQDEMGCILERDVLEAKLNFHDRKRLPNPQDEKLLLAATVQLLIEKALCLKEETPDGTYLVFPSYFRRERDEKPTYPEIHVTYSFTGNVDELYASLVVRLAYSGVFIKEELWQHAADFKTLTDGQAGVSVTDKGDGKAELVVYFSNDIALDSKITFLKFVHEHFQRRAFIVRDVQRVRTYVCAKCHYIHDLAVVSYQVREGEKELLCPRCGKCTSIYDEIEQRFSSDEFEKAVRAMEETAQITIDNQSKEMMLIGQVFDTVGQAGQIFRPTSMFDWGIDGELEFTTPGKDKKGNDISVASGTRLYLQLKSGDSYLRKRKDGTEVFDVSERHADYWQKQRYDVMLIVRNSDGSARWMNISDALKRTKSPPKHIVFTGEPFTKESVIQYRKRLLNR